MSKINIYKTSKLFSLSKTLPLCGKRFTKERGRVCVCVFFEFTFVLIKFISDFVFGLKVGTLHVCVCVYVAERVYMLFCVHFTFNVRWVCLSFSHVSPPPPPSSKQNENISFVCSIFSGNSLLFCSVGWTADSIHAAASAVFVVDFVSGRLQLTPSSASATVMLWRPVNSISRIRKAEPYTTSVCRRVVCVSCGITGGVWLFFHFFVFSHTTFFLLHLFTCSFVYAKNTRKTKTRALKFLFWISKYKKNIQKGLS